jgi:hypothetical protein
MARCLGMDEATIEGLALPSLFGGGIASHSPFQRFRCLPFSDASKRPATKRTYPLGFPNDVASQHRYSSREPGMPGRRVCLSGASYAAAEKSGEGTALKT